MKITGKESANIQEFIRNATGCENSLNGFYRLIENSEFNNLNELKSICPNADVVKTKNNGNLTVFNIGGNKFRLITKINYSTKMLMIREILTHAEYSKNRWKN